MTELKDSAQRLPVSVMALLCVLLPGCQQPPDSPTARAAESAAPQLAAAPVSSNYTLATSAAGVELYAGTDDTVPSYVQIIDLSAAARVTVLLGATGDPDPDCGCEADTGSCSASSCQSAQGPNPSYDRLSLDAAWQDLQASNSEAFCVVNGSFFCNTTTGSEPCDPTPLQYGLVLASVQESVGNGCYDAKDCATSMLSLWSDRAEIAPYEGDGTLCSGDSDCAPTIVVANVPSADRSPDDSVGRTYAGVSDRDGDGVDESVLLLSISQATDEGATGILVDFGVAPAKILMLDGGGSTQMHCVDGQTLPSSDCQNSNGCRSVPMMIGTSAAPG